jgi:hypothetical protein
MKCWKIQAEIVRKDFHRAIPFAESVIVWRIVEIPELRQGRKIICVRQAVAKYK